jgi:MerR family transcriptional regulator, copper efflux regulator
LHIDQVTEILFAAEAGRRPCVTTRALLDQRIGEIDRVVADLTAMRETLTATRDAPAAASSEAESAVCPVIENPRLRVPQNWGSPPSIEQRRRP